VSFRGYITRRISQGSGIYFPTSGNHQEIQEFYHEPHEKHELIVQYLRFSLMFVMVREVRG
jgi:predicted secreted protein